MQHMTILPLAYDGTMIAKSVNQNNVGCIIHSCEIEIILAHVKSSTYSYIVCTNTHSTYYFRHCLERMYCLPKSCVRLYHYDV